MTESPPPPNVPPGWPREVTPPGTEGWEDSAARWLIQWMPPGYRRHGVLRQEPAILAYMAQREIEASLNAARRGFSTTRADLREAGLEPDVIEKALSVYSEEGARLAQLEQQVGMLADALIRGVRWRPPPRRTQDDSSRRRGGMG
ncbi:hypothetical protein [Peterkaempfera griseoplana]|uniref:hypothetical protein n=1 Tax=Peterkaempfera griseoplana TaxID=66896 RepID=UPI0007C796F8|nr:hypothetical protein [Peterkaempfera griseoplana]